MGKNASLAVRPVELTGTGKARGAGDAAFVRSAKKDLFGVSTSFGETDPRVVTAYCYETFYINNSGNKIARNGDLVLYPIDSGNGPYKSFDGGKTITDRGGAQSAGAVRELCYLGSNIFMGIQYLYGIVRSTDNGSTWSAVNTGVAGLTSARYIDFCNGYALITQATASTTAAISTTGATWSSVTLPIAAGRVRVFNNRMTVWGSSNQIARATSDDLTTWETTTTPTNVSFVGYGGGKYVYIHTTGTQLVVYESYNFQNWSLLLSFSTTNTDPKDVLYDQWSKNFIFSLGANGGYYYGFNTFRYKSLAYSVGCVPCSGEDNSIMLVYGIGNTTPNDFKYTLIRQPEPTTITY